ncbi:unnamed protein product [Closterium sp. NIES-65]|nr:unnamed protein product [Closterium sp. NIES-65]
MGICHQCPSAANISVKAPSAADINVKALGAAGIDVKAPGAADTNVKAPGADINIEVSPISVKTEEAFGLGVESQEGAPSFPVVEAQQGVNVGVKESSGCCNLTRSEGNCSSHSARLIVLSRDTDTTSSTSSSLLSDFSSSAVSSVTNFMGVEMGIGRGFCSNGRGWTVEAKGVGELVEKDVLSNQLFGDGMEGDKSYNDFISSGKGSAQGSRRLVQPWEVVMKRASERVFVPLTVGGGIRDITSSPSLISQSFISPTSPCNRPQVLKRASERVFVPLTVGGGIRDFTDANGRWAVGQVGCGTGGPWDRWAVGQAGHSCSWCRR